MKKREILFKGQKNDTKEWVYGDLLHVEKNFEKKLIILDWTKEPYQIEVDKETVGQFTGMSDCNGIKIFEGDVLRWPKSEFNYLIKYENGAFICYHIDLKNLDECELKWGGIWRFAELGMETEVIGNIHDNSKPA